MRTQWNSWLAAAVCSAAMVMAGCGKSASPPAANAPANAGTSEEDKEIADAMAKLSAEERAVAMAQKYCPVAAMGEGAHDSLLGSMGAPVKVTLEGKDVYLCCDGCKEMAEKNPAATLAKAEELKTRAASEK